jgi:hypothetical protein
VQLVEDELVQETVTMELHFQLKTVDLEEAQEEVIVMLELEHQDKVIMEAA